MSLVSAVLGLRMDSLHRLHDTGDDLLVIAVRLGNPTAVETIFSALIDAASRAGNLAAVWWALCILCRDGPADPEASPADIAAVVSFLHKSMPGLDLRDEQQMTPYLYCCIHGHCEARTTSAPPPPKGS